MFVAGRDSATERNRMAIIVNEPVMEAYTDAERYAVGQTIFPAVTRHGEYVLTEALAWAEAVLRDKAPGPARDLMTDVIDVLREALREF
jgi:hypothetical protein